MAPPKARLTRATAVSGTLLNIANDQNAYGGLGGGGHGHHLAAAGKKAIKRKADASPVRNDKAKRSALGNLTNAVANNAKENAGHQNNGGVAAGVKPRKRDGAIMAFAEPAKPLGLLMHNNAENICGTNKANNVQLLQQQQQQCLAAPRPTKVLTRAAARATLPDETVASKKQHPQQLQQQQQHQQHQQQLLTTTTTATTLEVPDAQLKPRRRISNEFERSKGSTPDDDNSLYMSALESCDSGVLMGSDAAAAASELQRRRSSCASSLALANLSSSSDTSSTSNATLAIGELKLSGGDNGVHDNTLSVFDTIAQSSVPAGVVDFDKENWDDPFQASHYAMDIFNYLKTREPQFAVDDYIGRQQHISKWMRSLLIDWMVEVQETFELNHETLYLAVKVVDLYLARVVVVKDKLQLLGAAAMFLACKYDERTPPLIDDFLYICDGAYVQKELIVMEMHVFRTIGYDLGMPLSYRFLRRYGRCSKVPMAVLTLARYILEFSLMDYATVTRSESKLAAGALFMALRMSGHGTWDDTLRYYTGYELSELANVVLVLNGNLHQKPRDAIKTVRNKYSHKIFFEVARIPLQTAKCLFEGTGIAYERCAP